MQDLLDTDLRNLERYFIDLGSLHHLRIESGALPWQQKGLTRMCT